MLVVLDKLVYELSIEEVNDKLGLFYIFDLSQIIDDELDASSINSLIINQAGDKGVISREIVLSRLSDDQ